MKKILLVLSLILAFNSILLGYEDDYEKVYIVKISKKDIYRAVNADKKQQKKLDSIFEKSQKEASKIEGKLLTFEEKKERIGKIETNRYKSINKVLTATQVEKYNEYINNQKVLFEENNNKVLNLVESLNLTNEQKAEILKYERDFKRGLSKIDTRTLTPERFSEEYMKLREIRNDNIKKVLDKKQ